MVNPQTKGREAKRKVRRQCAHREDLCSCPNSLHAFGEGYLLQQKKSDWTYAHETPVDLKAVDRNRSDLFLKHFTRLRFVVNRVQKWVLLTSDTAGEPP